MLIFFAPPAVAPSPAITVLRGTSCKGPRALVAEDATHREALDQSVRDLAGLLQRLQEAPQGATIGAI